MHTSLCVTMPVVPHSHLNRVSHLDIKRCGQQKSMSPSSAYSPLGDFVASLTDRRLSSYDYSEI